MGTVSVVAVYTLIAIRYALLTPYLVPLSFF